MPGRRELEGKREGLYHTILSCTPWLEESGGNAPLSVTSGAPIFPQWQYSQVVVQPGALGDLTGAAERVFVEGFRVHLGYANRLVPASLLIMYI